jgi:actin
VKFPSIVGVPRGGSLIGQGNAKSEYIGEEA